MVVCNFIGVNRCLCTAGLLIKVLTLQPVANRRRSTWAETVGFFIGLSDEHLQETGCEIG